MICTSYASDSIFLNLEAAITKNKRKEQEVRAEKKRERVINILNVRTSCTNHAEEMCSLKLKTFMEKNLSVSTSFSSVFRMFEHSYTPQEFITKNYVDIKRESKKDLKVISHHIQTNY